MFNKYWRSYPWFFQLVQFIILIAVMASFFLFALTPLLLKMNHVSLSDIVTMSDHSPRKIINAALIIQFFTAIGIFLLPALLFAYFTHPKPLNYLGLRKPGKNIHWPLVIIVILSATPIFLAIADWISQIDFGASVKQAQDANDKAFKALLSMSSLLHLIGAFIVLAILPGISEELFFRGILMRFVAKRSRTIVFPLVLSALMFALMHTNIYGMLSIFLAGMLLGSIYYLTGSLWCGIVAHMCYNGFQIILTYAASRNTTLKAIEETNHVPVSWLIGGIIIFSFSFYMLWKNRTPLPDKWSDDFTEEELQEEKH